MKIKLSETEKAIIQNHTPAVRGRALLELEIVSALIRAARDADYYYKIKDEEEDVSTSDDLKRVLFDLDSATLMVHDDLSGSESIGWVHLIFGNDGYNLIFDYAIGLESFLKPVNDLADFWGGAQ